MDTLKKVDARQDMLIVNERQKDFYESRYEATEIKKQVAERAANGLTNLWTWLRYKLMLLGQVARVYDQIDCLHQAWMYDIQHAHVLDLGCFVGNSLSLWIAEHCADYTGIDLSEQATATLDNTLREKHLDHARAYKQDFLANTFADNSFDLIYAHAVLHHFQDMDVLLEELYRVLKPGGMIISYDPMMTEPLNRLARTLYRPFQTDRDWEWPFTKETLSHIQRYFEITAMQGLMGMVKLSFPFLLIPGLAKFGQKIGRWGVAFDRMYARRFGKPFYFCWMVTLRLRKPA